LQQQLKQQQQEVMQLQLMEHDYELVKLVHRTP
jgi:hypothetical protein